MAYHIISYNIMSFYIISYHVISGHSTNDIVFATEHHIFDYRGETLGNLIPGSNPPHYNGTDIMHARYGHNNTETYCLQLPNGQIIDAALHRGVAALANHGPMNGVHGIVANAEFKVHPNTNRAWIQAIRPIRNEDQIIVNYARGHRVHQMTEDGYCHSTN